MNMKKLLGAALVASLALSGVFASQPAVAQSVAGAPGVANVSVIQGYVTLVRGDSGAQVTATINTPVLPGDYISTGGGSRAEVQLDGISMLRLAQNAQVRFVSLDPSSREMQVASGTVVLAELQGADGSPQIDTPSLTVRPGSSGDYRVSVFSNGQTQVTVRSGSATVASGTGSQTLMPGTTLVAYGDYSNPSISLQNAIAWDAFDTFNANRDRAIVASYNANQYVTPGLSGYTNFSNYGQWYNVPGYGQSWAPYNQGNNWSPYSNGQWVWEPGYGYTWVANEPWGYAPYHYGNWYWSQNYNQWMWQPPGYQYQSDPSALSNMWLPALVAFFMTSLSGNYNPYSGYGGIGWVPLAPGEPYYPWYSGYGANAMYPQTGLYGGNVTNVYNIYRNIRYIKIVKIYRIDRFRDGNWGGPIRMRPDQIQHIAMVRGAVPIVPSRNLLGSGTKHTVVLSSQFHNPRFAARVPVTAKMTFDKQQQQLRTVVATKPKVATLPAHPIAVTHPVYAPPVEHRTPMHPPTMTVTKPKPVEVKPPVPVQHTMAPKPIEHPAPAVQHTMAPKPVERPAPPVQHTAGPKPPAPHGSAKPEPSKSPKDKPTPPGDF
jgi:hypothetical protein